jgi:hypothetical protein
VSPHIPLRIALLELLGFSLVIGVIWADELLDLPHHVFGAPATPLRIAEALFESITVGLLGLTVITMTLRIARRVVYLESFVVLCAWCRRVREEGHWTRLADYLEARRARTSHGLCPDCANRLEAEDRDPNSSAG